MTNLTVFDFNNNEVRVIVIDGDPWFVATDVCRVLEITNNRDAISRLDDDEKGVGISYTLGGKQDITVISESGLYSLVLTSRKPEAKVFKKWIISVLLPTLRKTGTYSVTQNNQQPIQALPPKRDKIDYVNAFKDIEQLKGQIPAAITQLLLDGLGDELVTLANEKQLPSSQPRLLGIAQKAEELGYKLTDSTRIMLGKFAVTPGLPRNKEKRLCNGQLRDINVYEDNQKLEEVIHLYFT